MRCLFIQLVLEVLSLLILCLAAPHLACAQSQVPDKSHPPWSQADQTANRAPDDADSGNPLTLFPHAESRRYWVSGQANFILQWLSTFPAEYSGKNSLRPDPENATSKLHTLYLG
jgi:hypothetical protein